MNTNFYAVIKKIVAEQGEDVLASPQRLKGLISDYAKNEPKPERLAFGRCIEYGFYGELKKTAAPEERVRVKAALAQRLHSEEGLDMDFCAGAVDVLEAVIWSVEPQKLLCASCGKELQEGWTICPFCRTAAAVFAASAQPVQQSTPTHEIVSINDSPDVGNLTMSEIAEQAKNKYTVSNPTPAKAETENVLRVDLTESQDEDTAYNHDAPPSTEETGEEPVNLEKIILDKDTEITRLTSDIERLTLEKEQSSIENQKTGDSLQKTKTRLIAAIVIGAGSILIAILAGYEQYSSIKWRHWLLQITYDSLQITYDSLVKDFNASKNIWAVNITSIKVGNTTQNW